MERYKIRWSPIQCWKYQSRVISDTRVKLIWMAYNTTRESEIILPRTTRFVSAFLLNFMSRELCYSRLVVLSDFPYRQFCELLQVRNFVCRTFALSFYERKKKREKKK